VVGRSEVQSCAASLDGMGATNGIFFGISNFSEGVRDYADRSKRIILIEAGNWRA
jgi:restriction endonuclease Mrr